jgi:hypothetical protein
MSVNKPGQLGSGVKIFTDMKSIKAVGILTMPTLLKATRHAKNKGKDRSIQ